MAGTGAHEVAEAVSATVRRARAEPARAQRSPTAMIDLATLKKHLEGLGNPQRDELAQHGEVVALQQRDDAAGMVVVPVREEQVVELGEPAAVEPPADEGVHLAGPA